MPSKKRTSSSNISVCRGGKERKRKEEINVTEEGEKEEKEENKLNRERRRGGREKRK